MADTVDTTARGLLMPSLRLRLMPSPLLPLSPATDTTATTARGPLMPSPAMATTAEDTAMEVTATGTAMAVDMDTTARGPLMPSPDMVTTAEGTDTDMARTFSRSIACSISARSFTNPIREFHDLEDRQFRIPFLGCFYRMFFILSIATQDKQKQG